MPRSSPVSDLEYLVTVAELGPRANVTSVAAAIGHGGAGVYRRLGKLHQLGLLERDGKRSFYLSPSALARIRSALNGAEVAVRREQRRRDRLQLALNSGTIRRGEVLARPYGSGVLPFPNQRAVR